MSGSKIGGLKTAAKLKQEYGDDYYVRIGALGGKFGKKDGVFKGFAVMPIEKVRAAGAKGGETSRRKPKGLV